MTDHPFSSSNKHKQLERAAVTNPVLLPSHRVVEPPRPGTKEADLLANFNAVYGLEDARDEQVIEGIGRAMRSILEGVQL